MEKQTLSSRSMKIASPVQSIEAINKVISVLFTYKRAVTYQEITPATNLHKTTVSQALSASRNIGLTELAGKKGLYILTKEGEEYGRLVTAGKIAEAKTLLRKILLNNPLWSEIIVFLKATFNQERDPIDLVLDVERKLGKQWSKGMRYRIRDSYISILSYAGLIEKKGNKIISRVKKEATEMPSELTVSEPTRTLLSSEFAKLIGDDFKFEVRRSLDAIEFAESQFLAWINYLKKQIVESQHKD